MKTALILIGFSLSSSLGFVAGTAYDQRKPVSAYQFYETSGFARVLGGKRPVSAQQHYETSGFASYELRKGQPL